MTLFITIWFCFAALGAACRLIALAAGEYPRVASTSRVGDVLALVVSAGLLLWAARLIGWI